MIKDYIIIANNSANEVNETLHMAQKLFDTAFELNNNGEGTDLSKMVTDYTVDIMQELSRRKPEIIKVTFTDYLKDCRELRNGLSEIYGQENISQQLLYKISDGFKRKYELSEYQQNKLVNSFVGIDESIWLWNELCKKY